MSNGSPKRPRIAVVGSANVDMVVRVPRRPQKGETLIGVGFDMVCGGKGSNQAIAAARSGADVWIVGRLGDDIFGDQCIGLLQAEGIHTDAVARDSEQGTGIASIMIDEEGDNSIVIIPRANMALTSDDVHAARDMITAAQVLLLQLEVPDEASEYAAAIARRAGVRVVLNPAPARRLSRSFLELVDILVPNETETEILSGHSTSTEAEIEAAARELIELGPRAVLLTLGARGAMLVERGRVVRQPAYPVHVVDTTAAGDAFCGALGTALAGGSSIDGALRYGCAAGALACTRLGASTSMPRSDEVARFLAENECKE